ncbi:MAG TPA: ABC transporter permease [Bacillota bacterium]|jgi:NitT/TauT family transport system permease protein
MSATEKSTVTPATTTVPAPEWKPTRKKVSWWSSIRVQVLSVGTFMILWQLLARNLNPILMPTPSLVVNAYADLIHKGALQKAFMVSLSDMGYGYIIAVVIGSILGVLMGRFKTVEKIISPYVSFFMATPTVALVPLVIIWFGFSQPARVFLVATVAIWPVAINTAMGVKVLPRVLREVGWAFRLTEAQFIRWVALPNAVPYILAGLRVALGRAVVGMIVAEMTMELVGLGGLVMVYGNAFKTAHLIAGVITSAVFAVFASVVMDVIRDKFFPWIKGASG